MQITAREHILVVEEPSILQSGNGRDFANNVNISLKKFSPAIFVAHGKPFYSER